MILSILLTLASISHSVSNTPILTTSHGSYVGNSSIPGLNQYLGLRYARPPVQHLRFAPPQPWPSQPSDLVNAASYGPGCPQLTSFELYNGLSEDCLTLNIVVPEGSNVSSLPVMFWIHGGGNANGQSIFYNGTALVQYSVSIGKPVVYVGINYRLGGFGFLTSPDFNEAGLSNVGLMDQHRALEWVHNHIADFGGDSDKVTIFGESAGAADCWAQSHYASTHDEEGMYFRAMITQSGAPGSPAFPALLDPTEGSGAYDDLLIRTNCVGFNDTVACLRAVPYEDIAPILTNVSIVAFTLDNTWFNDDLISLLEAGEFAKIPTIHGANLDEGSAFMPDVFQFPNISSLTNTIADTFNISRCSAFSIIEAYYSVPISELGKGFISDPTAPDDFYRAMAVYSDLWMHLGRRAWLEKASQSQKTWGYVFKQQPPLSTLNLSYEYPGYTDDYYRRLGVYHGAELSYVFGEVSNVANHSDGDVRLASNTMSWWITFAYDMDPNSDECVHWPLYNSTKEGTIMTLQEQGNITSAPGPDVMRQAVYEAWNEARCETGLSEIY